MSRLLEDEPRRREPGNFSPQCERCRAGRARRDPRQGQIRGTNGANPECMIPGSITTYLTSRHTDFVPCPHPTAYTAQEVASTLHVSGNRVAKTVMIEADGDIWVAVLPAPERIDLDEIAELLGADEVRMLEEREFAERFKGCEPGAAPPFGRLFGLPVVVDECLGDEDEIVVRGGSHQDAIEMSYADFVALEQPTIGSIHTH